MFKIEVRLPTLEFWVSASQKTYTVLRLSTFYILHNTTSTLIYCLICVKYFKYKSTHLVLMKTILSTSLCFAKLTTAISGLPRSSETCYNSSRDGVYFSSPWTCVSICDCLYSLIEYDRRDTAWLPRIQLPPGFFSLRMVVLESSHCAVKSPRPHGEAIYKCSDQRHPAKILADGRHQPPVMEANAPSGDSSL